MKALIFDMDGTMVDNMPYHLQAWERTLKWLGKELTGEALLKEMYGKNEEVLERIFGKGHFPAEKLKEISAQKEEWFREIYKPHMKAVKGLPEFLQTAKSQGILLGIGTASIFDNVSFIIDTLDLRRYFDVIVSAREVTVSKPDPQTFLLVAEKLKVAPEDCLVFEDVPKGVETARNAGMKAIVVGITHKKEAFKDFDNIIKFVCDFTEVSLKDFP